MEQKVFSRLVELSCLPEGEMAAAIATAQPGEIRDYLDALNNLGRLQVPAPSASKKWAGRVALLEAVGSYHRPSRPAFSMGWLRELRGAAAGVAISAAIFASVAAGSTVAGVTDSGGTFSEVLSALGLKAETKPETPAPAVLPPPEAQPLNPADFAVPSPAQTEPPVESGAEPAAPVVLPPQQVLDSPVQGGEHPGQGQESNPPGQSGEHPGQGQGADPPGHGGENPGQGQEGDPPDQGGENPGQGQGGDPPGQGGENPGQGAEPPGQGEASPGQGSGGQGSSQQGGGQAAEPPGLSGENSSQGGNPQGNGSGNSNQP